MPMANKITITLPTHLDDTGIKAYFFDNLENIWGVLDLELEDDRAQVDEVVVDEITLFDEEVNIHYCVQYSAYHGCKDINYVDDDLRFVAGTRSGRTFVFDEFLPPEPRSTREEF